MQSAGNPLRDSNVRRDPLDLKGYRTTCARRSLILKLRMAWLGFCRIGQVPFKLTEPTREALASWLGQRGARSNDWLFPSRSRLGDHLTTRQYGRLLDDWIALIGLDPASYGTHSLRRTKVALLYKRTGNLRACQLLLGHTKLESTVR